MKIHIALVIIMLVFILWSLHGLDLEYYVNNRNYNEGFDNNLKIAFFLIVMIISLLLFSETVTIYTRTINNN